MNELTALGAKQVLESLQQMAGKHSNPVLEVMPEDGQIVEMQHYPEPPLDFQQQPWRAYYHCHREPRLFDDEHGHFHLFTRLQGRAGWSHVAGLSMDSYGQPRRWFATNRWVTDESWADAGELFACLQSLVPHNSLRLVEKWLLGMVALCSDQLFQLWQQRDQKRTEFMAENGEKCILENRDFYLFAQQELDLLSTLDSGLKNSK